MIDSSTTTEPGFDEDADRVERLMAEWLATPMAERRATLERICADNSDLAPEIRDRIEALRSLGIECDAASGSLAFPDRLGDFRLLRRIGGGGMGVVYSAEQESLGREVALKLIRPEQLYFPGAKERFQREVESIARMQHPGIVPIYSVGTENGVPYFVMERIEGCTLAEVLKELEGRNVEALEGAHLARTIAELTSERLEREIAPQTGADLFAGTWGDTALRIAFEVAQALEHAHAKGVLHRDIKPSNVLLTPDGRVMLFDFGLASSRHSTRLTQTGSHVGSLPYMSPEQLKSGKQALDERTDVYSLGVTLYELLTLHLPHWAESSDELRDVILSGVVEGPRHWSRAVPRDVETVCMTAMEPDANRRYGNARVFAMDLANVLERRPIIARSPGRWYRFRRWVQRHPTASVATVSAFLLLVVAPLVAWWNVRTERDHLARALTDLERLSHGRVARELLSRAEDLYPAGPDDVPEFERWLATAGELVAARPLHADALERLEAQPAADARSEELDRVHAGLGASDVSARDDGVAQWKAEVLREVLDDIDRVSETSARIDRAREYLAGVEELTVTGAAASAAWDEALASIASNPRYARLEITPQVGLLPLGLNEQSGLWEFWMPQTGERPVADPSSGQWVVWDESALVFVLVPTGPFYLRKDGELVDIRVEPFFISKYEMTQGQWSRTAGSNPSTLTPDYEEAEVTLAHPVETVSFHDCEHMLRRLGLMLPTEAQWAFASQGGTSTRFYFGDDVSLLPEHGNMDSVELGAWDVAAVVSTPDGHGIHAPVGSYLPNPFGLHDVCGNVSEWCRQRFERTPFRPLGNIPPTQDLANEVIRGGAFDLPPEAAERTARLTDEPHTRTPTNGLRPVLAIQRQ